MRSRVIVFGALALALLSVTTTAYAAHRYKDVPDDHRFAGSVQWATDLGITKGCGDGTKFCPLDPVTRGQMVEFLQRTMESSANRQPGPQGPPGPSGPQGSPGPSAAVAPTWQIARRQSPVVVSDTDPVVIGPISVTVPSSRLMEYAVLAEAIRTTAGDGETHARIDVVVDGDVQPSQHIAARTIAREYYAVSTGPCAGAPCEGPGRAQMWPIFLELDPGVHTISLRLSTESFGSTAADRSNTFRNTTLWARPSP